MALNCEPYVLSNFHYLKKLNKRIDRLIMLVIPIDQFVSFEIKCKLFYQLLAHSPSQGK
jgi:hypothetical protein